LQRSKNYDLRTTNYELRTKKGETKVGTIHKTMTAAALTANEGNSAASTGPATESGKEQSKMNAFKNGKYARRPDPVEMLLKDHTQEEEAERQELRAEMIRCYGPPDDFARLQTEELADLQFELRRLERAREAVLARERELLELEQRRRAFRLKQGVEATSKEVNDRGLLGQPDSPGKFREILRTLESLVDQNHDLEIDNVRTLVYRVYGDGERAWRGVRLRWALTNAEKAESDEQRERASQDFATATKREIELVREELTICELDQGPLSPAAQAARLLETMNSRQWSWMERREMSLRRSIDRKLRMLMDLRREANRMEDRAARQASDQHTAGSQGNSTSGESGGASGGGAGGLAGADDPMAAASTPSPESPAPSPEPRLGRGIDKQGPNRGTNPLSALLSAEAWTEVRLPFPAENDLLLAGTAFGSPDRTRNTVRCPASRS
jgi:hypothetical protein